MPRNDFQNIPRRKLRDGVQDQLLAALDRGTYGPGTEIPSERELMAQMGVGRPAVREALMALEHRGLITIAHGRRARVREQSAAGLPQHELTQRTALSVLHLLERDDASVTHLTEARALFETAVVRLAAERITPAGATRLKRALADNRRAIPDAELYLATDMALHRTIAALSGNPLLAAAGEAIHTWLPRFRIRMVHVEGANLLSYREHERVVERIVAHDPQGALAAIETHLARSHALYEKLATDILGKAPATRVANVKAPNTRTRSRRGGL